MRKKEEKEKRRKTLSPFLFPPFQGLGWAREEKSLYNLGRGQTPPPFKKVFQSSPSSTISDGDATITHQISNVLSF